MLKHLLMNDEPGQQDAGQGTPPAQQQEPAKTFSQEDVNNLIAKESRAAQEKLLRDLGVTDTKSAKEGLAKLKEMQDAQKTEAEKLAADLAASSEKITAAETRALAAEAKLEAIASGVPADKADKVIKLAAAYDGETMADKIKAVLEEFPELKGQPPAAPAPQIGGKTDNQNMSDIDKMRAVARRAMGLTT